MDCAEKERFRTGAEVAGRAVSRRAVGAGTSTDNETTNGAGAVQYGTVTSARSEVGPQPGPNGLASGSQATAGAATDRKEAERVADFGDKEKKTVCGIPVSSKCVVS